MDPVEIAAKSCKYFTNIGPNLARGIRDLNFSLSSFLVGANHPPIILQPTDPCELESIVACSPRGRPPAMTIFQCV